MDFPQFTEEQTAGLKVIIGAILGTALMIGLRWPGSILRAAFLFSVGLGTALLFSSWIASILHAPTEGASFVVGLTGKAIADGILRAVEKIDFGKILPFDRPGDVQ